MINALIIFIVAAGMFCLGFITALIVQLKQDHKIHMQMMRRK
jgi:hypothetical protein